LTPSAEFTRKPSAPIRAADNVFMQPVLRACNTQNEVVIRVNSGLGNQLFQLAYGLHLSRERKAQLLMDTTWFDLVAGFHQPKRTFRLNQYLVEHREAFRGPRRLAVGFFAALYDWKRRGLTILEALGRLHVVQEQTSMRRQPKELFPVQSQRLYLNGYWQTAEAFLATRQALLPLLQPKCGLSSAADHWIRRVKAEPTAFIHVRRGDYVDLMGSNGLLTPGYYSTAVKTLSADRQGDLKWVVFSENREWARANLGFLTKWELVEYDSINRDVEDLAIMAACDAAIIANSSYSWWGAALGDRPDRVVIAPDQYWNKLESSLRDWVLPGWIQVQAWE